MGRYSRRRNIKKFWKNPLVNLCYVLSVLAFVAGVLLVFGFIGGADCLPAAIIALAAGVLLIILGKRLNIRKKEAASAEEKR
ncbi:MAG: hypothetical protein Q4F31_04850 [Eubacteriales bacterium]|nr:hypothetical protein [Eubacteriales bacterium]